MARLLPFRSPERAEVDRDPRLVEIDEEAADEVFSALSSETARRIVARLYEEPATASDLAEAVDTSLQNVRYHLEKLQDAGLIEDVDTWYSSRGTEMTVYAPSSDPLVVTAGPEETTGMLRSALQRLVGAVVVLGLASLLVDRLVRRFGAGALISTGGAPAPEPEAGADGGAGGGGAGGAGGNVSTDGGVTGTPKAETAVATRTPEPTTAPETATRAVGRTTAATRTPEATGTPAPTATATPSPAPTPTPTATPTPSPTPTPPATTTTAPTPAAPPDGAMVEVAGAAVPPGALFFAGGLLVLLLATAWWYWTEYRPLTTGRRA